MNMFLAREPVSENPKARVRLVEDDLACPEVYRQLAASLDLELERGPVIGITSAIRGEGRTTVALGLASTLATDLDCPVTLVEADFYGPSLSEHFDLPRGPGMADILRDGTQFSALGVLVRSGLSVITAGEIQDDAASLLYHLSVQDPFHKPDRSQGAVIVDLPPILSQGYSSQAAQLMDALVLVVRAGVTPVDAVREAISRLGDCTPRGVVFNGPRSALPSWWRRFGK
jgi:protein-tyrosine kinase